MTRCRVINLITFCMILGILDATLTDLGLKFNFIYEANPLMLLVYKTSNILFYFIKISPYILLFILYKKIKHSKVVGYLLELTTVVYSYIIILHLNWIAIITMT